MANQARKKRRRQAAKTGRGTVADAAARIAGNRAKSGTAKDSRTKVATMAPQPIWSRTRESSAPHCGTYDARRKQMRSDIEDVGPEKAMEYLGTSEGNRRKNHHTVTRYANDMRRKKWVLTAQGIIFDTNGVLVDGHRRLYAIIRSGETIKLYVTRDMPKESVAFLDIGEVRKPKDTLAREGIKSGSKIMSMVKAAILGYNSRLCGDVSGDQELTAVFNNRGDIEWIFEELGRGQRAPVAGAILRAVANEGQTDRLRQFCNHLRDGTNEGRKCPVNALKRHLGKVGAKTASGTQNDLYPRVVTALKKFLAKEELVNISAAKSDHWPFDLD